MSLRTLMQAGPAKANELFSKLSDTSEGAVKTREKIFSELKSELELHTNLEEQHLFPVLRRNAETKEIVTEAIKDNKALRMKLTELEALPKNDENFSERIKELQKSFRQHARDEKRELLPAVQRALSEEQVQHVAEKIEAGVAEAGQAKQDELEERRTRARQEREQAVRQAEQQEAAEQARKAAAEQVRHVEAEQKRVRLRAERETAEREAAQEAAATQAKDEALRSAHEAAETVARTATAAQSSALRIAQSTATGVQRAGTEINNAAGAYFDAVRSMAPDPRAVAALPNVVVGAMAEMRSAWMSWMGKTTLAGVQMSQELLGQAAERQRRFAADAVQGWMEQNARFAQITMRVAQEVSRPMAKQASPDANDRRSSR